LQAAVCIGPPQPTSLPRCPDHATANYCTLKTLGHCVRVCSSHLGCRKTTKRGTGAQRGLPQIRR
jgi:hypothetical protein